MVDDTPALFRSCSMEGCERPFHARDLCKMHWRRWSRHGDPSIVNRQPREGLSCSIAGCERAVQSKGYCKRHHRRWLLYGDPLFSPIVPVCGCDKCVKLRRREATDRWRKRNPDRAKAKYKAWAQANPDRIVEGAARRRARKLACDVREISERDWARLCARHRHCCAYCGAAAKLTQDHVIPLSRGGRHSIGNVVPACSACNSSKHARLLVEWRYRRRHHRVA